MYDLARYFHISNDCKTHSLELSHRDSRKGLSNSLVASLRKSASLSSHNCIASSSNTLAPAARPFWCASWTNEANNSRGNSVRRLDSRSASGKLLARYNWHLTAVAPVSATRSIIPSRLLGNTARFRMMFEQHSAMINVGCP